MIYSYFVVQISFRAAVCRRSHSEKPTVEVKTVMRNTEVEDVVKKKSFHASNTTTAALYRAQDIV
jgi:hypothetical protein